MVKRHGGEALLTSKKHKNGTERIFEISKNFKNLEYVIDIQGDQPLFDPRAIDKTIEFHRKNKKYDIVLPSMHIHHDPGNKNLVKTIFSKNGKLIYFSRALTPFNHKKAKIKYFKNLSIVSFKPNALKIFFNSKMGKIEKIEGIELMRALENDLSIGTFVMKGDDFAVDVNEDLMKAIDVMPRDRIRKLY